MKKPAGFGLKKMSKEDLVQRLLPNKEQKAVASAEDKEWVAWHAVEESDKKKLLRW